ncbi:hypothetical protein KJ596_03115 [Patescibacteria group bacterium]|nr:hypothetical protein [Patescibacteria group bacterium]MBU1868436.1 hypothetical protein [Patescibacteria group bacterium]
MIPDSLIQKAKGFALSQAEEYGAPSPDNFEYINTVGQQLASQMGATKDIVLLATSLSDCMLGPAFKTGNLSQHISMAVEKANELILDFPEISNDEKENIIHSLKEHHGTDKFYSLEAEICCNADCYRFASVDGVIGGIRYVREMPLDNLIDILSKKADEKWNALTLDICKNELEPQYKLIKQFLKQYQDTN